jgi:ADP-ribose pyrophosphatase YjhB (NUDIX family)
MEDPQWLVWVTELQAIAQAGLTFASDRYDLARYQRLRAIAVAMMASGSGAKVERISGLFEQDLGYPTPKVGVRGAVFRDQRILMVREISDGCWTLPGGWADVNQSPRECVEREIQEESGFLARAVKLAAVWDNRSRRQAASHPYTIYKMFFICELIGGEASPSIETSEVEFFALDELPHLSLGRVTPEQIGRMYEHWRNPELMTEFD